jgi:hypothetical protein
VAFLRKNNICYPEDILWVEDVWHTAMCLLKADRVCYLPQFIGYHYFINSGSIIQDKKKSYEDLLDCFRSAQHIIDDLKAIGVDTNDTATTLMILLTQYYLGSDLTIDQRRTLSDMIRPYLMQVKKLTPSKIHSPEECYLNYHLPREVLGNPENPWASPTLYDERNGWSAMMKILRSNATTDFGRRYHFSEIETLADYQQKVPMTDQSNYKRLLDLQANIGESSILTSEPTSLYLINAKGQRVPSTQSHMRPYMESFATTLKHHHNLLVALVGLRQKQTNDGCTVETLESEMVKKYMWYYHFARGKRRATFSMSDDLFFKTNPHEEMRTICFYALADRDIDQLVAINTRRIADMFEYMSAHREELIEEIRGIDALRANEVEVAFHSGEPLANALWPNLQRIVAFGTGEYYDSTTRMKVYTGQTPHNNGYYYTEEAIYGRAVADNSDVFETIPSTSFHEYLPLGSDDTAATVLSTDVKVGEPYQLVVTNSSGLYRYVTDHIVRIQEKQNDKVLFTIY